MAESAKSQSGTYIIYKPVPVDVGAQAGFHLNNQNLNDMMIVVSSSEDVASTSTLYMPTPFFQDSGMLNQTAFGQALSEFTAISESQSQLLEVPSGVEATVLSLDKNSCEQTAIGDSELAAATFHDRQIEVPPAEISLPPLTVSRDMPEKDQSVVEEHIALAVDSPMPIPSCEKCGLVCDSFLTLLAHNRKCKDKKPLQCEYCTESFNHGINLRLHQATHSDCTGEAMKCPECEKTFTRLASFRCHIALHVVDETVFCSICHEEFEFVSQQQRHQMQVHQFKPPRFKYCRLCGDVFIDPEKLKEHMTAHKKVRKILGTKQRKIRQKVDRNTENRNLVHRCNECHKVFSRQSALVRHMPVHNGQRAFICEVCGASFTQKGALMYHARVHLSVKPFICDLCGKGFNQRGNLRAHVLRTHPVSFDESTSFPCPACSCVFKRVASLNMHMTKMHPTFFEQNTFPAAKDTSMNSDTDKASCNKKNVRNCPASQALQGQQEETTEARASALVIDLDSSLKKGRRKEGSADSKKTSPATAQCTAETPYADSVNFSNVVSDRPEERIGTSVVNESSTPQMVAKDRLYVGDGMTINNVRTFGGKLNTLKIDGKRHYLCPKSDCAKTFRKPSDLVRHFRTHTDERPYSCHICFSGFRTKHALTGHLRAHANTKLAQCGICQKTYANEASLKAHMTTAHLSGNRHHYCKHCGKIFRSSQAALKHAERCNFLVTLSDNYAGEGSNAKVSSELLEKIAQLKRGSQLNFAVDQLQKVSELGNPLVINEFSGEIVGLIPDRATTLNDPAKTQPFVDGEGRLLRPYACAQCPLRFKRSIHLKQHVRTQHTKERPFRCWTCGKCFALHSSLKIHLARHDGTRSFRCGVCAAAFVTRNSLTRHKVTHSTSTPFSCPYCGRRFKRGTLCRQHIKVKHKAVESIRAWRQKLYEDDVAAKEQQCRQQQFLPSQQTSFPLEGERTELPLRGGGGYATTAFAPPPMHRDHNSAVTSECYFSQPQVQQDAQVAVLSNANVANFVPTSQPPNYGQAFSTMETNTGLPMHYHPQPHEQPQQQSFQQSAFDGFQSPPTGQQQLSIAIHTSASTSDMPMPSDFAPNIALHSPSIISLNRSLSLIDRKASQQQQSAEGHRPASNTADTLQSQQDEVANFSILDPAYLEHLSSVIADMFGNEDVSTGLTNLMPCFNEESLLRGGAENSLLSPTISLRLLEDGFLLGAAEGDTLASIPSFLRSPNPTSQYCSGQQAFAHNTAIPLSVPLGDVSPDSQRSAAATTQSSAARAASVISSANSHLIRQSLLLATASSAAVATSQTAAAGASAAKWRLAAVRSPNSNSFALLLGNQQYSRQCNRGTFQCDKCSQTFLSEALLSEHRQRLHPVGASSFPCDKCGKPFKGPYERARHLATVHSKKRKSTKLPLESAKLFSRAEYLKQRGNVVTQAQTAATAASADPDKASEPALLHPAAANSDETIVVSTVAAESLKSAVAVVSLHESIAEVLPKRAATPIASRGIRNCAFCDKPFRKPCDLIRHQRVHTGERPYMCTRCNKSFKTKSAWTYHTKTHDNVGPMFSCNGCNQTFAARSSLNVHMRIHTNVKPVVCPHCPERFYNSSQKRVHMKVHTMNLTPKALAQSAGLPTLSFVKPDEGSSSSTARAFFAQFPPANVASDSTKANASVDEKQGLSETILLQAHASSSLPTANATSSGQKATSVQEPTVASPPAPGYPFSQIMLQFLETPVGLQISTQALLPNSRANASLNAGKPVDTSEVTLDVSVLETLIQSGFSITIPIKINVDGGGERLTTVELDPKVLLQSALNDAQLARLQNQDAEEVRLKMEARSEPSSDEVSNVKIATDISYVASHLTPESASSAKNQLQLTTTTLPGSSTSWNNSTVENVTKLTGEVGAMPLAQTVTDERCSLSRSNSQATLHASYVEPAAASKRRMPKAKRVFCEICSKGFPIPSQLKRHMKVHYK